MVIAGQSGSKSTFAGGLYQHVDRSSRLRITQRLKGSEDDYHDRVIRPMFSQNMYPKQTRNGYVVEYEITADGAYIPDTNIEFVDLPGEQQEGLLDPPQAMDLVTKIERGNIPDAETVHENYRNNVRDKFDIGTGPETNHEWETTFLHYYYQADDVLFLMNLHKVIEQAEPLAYDKMAIEHVVSEKTNVAIVPTAVDLVGYDPDADDPTVTQRVTAGLKSLISPQLSDSDLKETISNHLGPGEAREVNNILNYVDQEPQVDFFGVSVPDKNRSTDELTADGDGGFVTRGFDQVVSWLR